MSPPAIEIEQIGQGCLTGVVSAIERATGIWGSSVDYLAGKKRALTWEDQLALRDFSASGMIDKILLPAMAEATNRGTTEILFHRMIPFINDWQNTTNMAEDTSFFGSLVGHRELFARDEGYLTDLLAHLTPVRDIFVDLSARRLAKAGAGESQDELTAQWKKTQLRAAQRLAEAARKSVFYAAAHDDKATLQKTHQYLVVNQNASLLFESFDLAGPEISAARNSLAQATLLATPDGEESTDVYNPNILFWALSSTQENIGGRSVAELNRRFDRSHRDTVNSVQTNIESLPFIPETANIWRHLTKDIRWVKEIFVPILARRIRPEAAFDLASLDKMMNLIDRLENILRVPIKNVPEEGLIGDALLSDQDATSLLLHLLQIYIITPRAIEAQRARTKLVNLAVILSLGYTSQMKTEMVGLLVQSIREKFKADRGYYPGTAGKLSYYYPETKDLDRLSEEYAIIMLEWRIAGDPRLWRYLQERFW